MNNTMNKIIVTTSNFESFVGSLKQNLKAGFGVCESTEYINGFFKATLVSGNDELYISKLNKLSGMERENVLDLLSHLGNSVGQEYNVENIVVAVNGEEIVPEEITSKEVVVKIKNPVRKARGKKGGQ